MFQKILILISSQDLVGGSYQRNFFIGKVSLWFLLIYTWYTKVLNIFDKWFTAVFCSVALYGHLNCGSSEIFERICLLIFPTSGLQGFMSLQAGLLWKFGLWSFRLTKQFFFWVLNTLSAISKLSTISCVVLLHALLLPFWLSCTLYARFFQ